VVSASIRGDDLQWSISGRDTTKEDTISHYVVFISRDGENLMQLASPPRGVHSLELGRYRLPAGKYFVLVKAVGVASVKNHMSNAAAYVVNRERRAEARLR